VTPSLETLALVARRTMQLPFRMWAFGEAIALRGLLAAASVMRAAELSGFVHALLRATMARGLGSHPEDHMAPGMEFLSFYETTREEKFLRAARVLAMMHDEMPATTYGAKLHRASLPGWREQIWVDTMDVDPPFLARLAYITGEERYIRQCATEIVSYARLLQDETRGLFYHGYEKYCGQNGEFWARGNGWALLGLTETLRWLPPETAEVPELRQRLESLCNALRKLQTETGLWHTVMDDPATFVESTLAVMFAYATPLCGAMDCASQSQLSRNAIGPLIAGDGSLMLVTDATPIGTRAMYATRPFGVYAWGQGPLLMLLAGLERKT
jgi:unsaturated rhamnogalacturonyl hydrolase